MKMRQEIIKVRTKSRGFFLITSNLPSQEVFFKASKIFSVFTGNFKISEALRKMVKAIAEFRI